MVTAPAVGLRSPRINCASVDFPAPEGPTMPTASPRRRARVASVKAMWPFG